MISGISFSCFVLFLHRNAGADVAYHAWVLSAAQDGKGLPVDSRKQALSPSTAGKAASTHAKCTVSEDDKDCFIWSRHAHDWKGTKGSRLFNQFTLAVSCRGQEAVVIIQPPKEIQVSVRGAKWYIIPFQIVEGLPVTFFLPFVCVTITQKGNHHDIDINC